MRSRSAEHTLSALAIASGVAIALAPNLAGVDPMSFSGVKTDLGNLIPSLGTAMVVLGVGLAISGVLSIWTRATWAPATTIALSVGTIVALLTANASVLVGTAGERSFGLLDLGGTATGVALVAAGLALAGGVALAAVRIAGDAAVPVLRAPA